MKQGVNLSKMSSPLSKSASSALVVGYGSIGKRHVEILHKQGINVAVFSRRFLPLADSFNDLSTAIQSNKPSYIVVANRTGEHVETLQTLDHLGYTGKILVEKPLFSDQQAYGPRSPEKIRVAYNLRYHPLIQNLRTALKGQKICTFQVYVGQYLPNWRPDTDYRQSYSANKNAGGGALLDLSHDIDYATWILGGWQAVAAQGGRVSDLEITSDDSFSLMLQTPRCPHVLVHMNYLDRCSRREIVVNTTTQTLKVDLVNGIFQIDNDQEFSTIDRNATYTAMHEDMQAPASAYACTYGQGLDLINLIAAARTAAENKIWITR